jgi:hypothetical protein
MKINNHVCQNYFFTEESTNVCFLLNSAYIGTDGNVLILQGPSMYTLFYKSYINLMENISMGHLLKILE